jgi:phenylacetate-CoA ligase
MGDRAQRQVDVVRAITRGSSILAAHRWPRERLECHRDERLRALVRHARAASPFHRERLRGLEVDAPDLLARLPTMNKQMMMRDLARVLTDPRLRDIDLDGYLQGLTGDPLLSGCYRVMATGGTSGQRGLFVYDRAGWTEVMAIFAAGPRWLGVSPRLPRPRMATIWASGPAHMTARLAASFRTPIFRRLHLTATMPLAQIVRELNAFNPEWLSSYPSIAALLADEQQAGRLHIAPRVVLVSSEQCTPAMRARIASAWGVQPYNTYATTEGSTTAVECERHHGLHIFESHVIVEVVDDDGQPVPDGQPGAKVLVTNLFNHVQPLIRYELSDLVTIAREACPCGRTTRRIQSIDGRADDIMQLRTPAGDQVPVHPNHFAEAIEAIAGIRSYQVTQQHDGIDIAIVVADRDQTKIVADVTTAIRRRLAPLGVGHAALHVRTVEQIPRPDAVSGKFKLIRALSDVSVSSAVGHHEGPNDNCAASVAHRSEEP